MPFADKSIVPRAENAKFDHFIQCIFLLGFLCEVAQIDAARQVRIK